jgi:hypothetical protein
MKQDECNRRLEEMATHEDGRWKCRVCGRCFRDQVDRCALYKAIKAHLKRSHPFEWDILKTGFALFPKTISSVPKRKTRTEKTGVP